MGGRPYCSNGRQLRAKPGSSEAKKWCATSSTSWILSDAYISGWNPNKTADGREKQRGAAEAVNAGQPHTASSPVSELLELLRPGNEQQRLEYHRRAVRAEHLHDLHYLDPSARRCL